MTTLRQVNAALAKAGAAEILAKGTGYFYFTQGNAEHWASASVMTPRLSDLTVEQWLQEHRALVRKNEH